MPTVRNPHQREVRYARQASADACAFCRLLAIRPEAQYSSEESALYAHHEMGNLYHGECSCTAVPLYPGETYEMPDYTEQWVADYSDARDDQDVESIEDVLNYMRRAQYARDNPKDEPTLPEAPRRAAAIMRDNVVTKTVDAQVNPIESDDAAGQFEVVLSTESLDRDGERLFIDEWKTPLPSRIHFDSDHGMSIEKTVGSGVPRIEGDRVVVRGSYAKTPHAQMVRDLVNEGHITSTSVTFRNIRTAKDARPQRELLNGAFVAVPANAEAVVLSSKAAKTDDDAKTPYGPKSEVTYADPGYQDDGKARYPVDTREHVLSALSYIGDPKNAGKYSAAELSKIKGRIRSAAAKFDITIADDKKSLMEWDATYVDVLSKQLDASGDNPAPRHDDMIQAIHDAAVQLGGQCTNRTQADTGEDEGANKSFTYHKTLPSTYGPIPDGTSSLQTSSPGAGSLQESAEESAAATTTAHKAAVVAAADESADNTATQQAFLAARGRSLAFQMKRVSEQE